jgi:hypothetical protein
LAQPTGTGACAPRARDCLHYRAPRGEVGDVSVGHLGVVVGAAHGEDVGEPCGCFQSSPLAVVQLPALHLERPHARRAQARRVPGFDGHEVALRLVVVADEPCDSLAEQVGHCRRAGPSVGARAIRPEHGAHVVDQPRDLELAVVRRNVGDKRRALQAVRQQVDVLGIGRAGAGLENVEERVNVRDGRARHVSGR